MQNLLYNAATWLKLDALLITVNYTSKEVVINIKEIILKLIKKSFMVYNEILKLKLCCSLSKIHFLIDMWTLLNY